MNNALLGALFLVQAAAALVLVRRLAAGRHRARPVEPGAEAAEADDASRRSAATTIVVPTLNEAERIGPLLARIPAQGPPVHEVLVVDSGSTDGTRELVERAAEHDARIRLVSDPPLPEGWIGKAWALEHARRLATGEWLLCLDADIEPAANAAATAVAVAEREGLDVVSFSPQFAGQTAFERFLHPSILASLVYRTDPPGPSTSPDRVLANGQFFLVRRSVLEQHGGYAPVRESFAEDVSLARHLARHGARVAFLDGRNLFTVRSYRSAREMWREWGRSVDLRDATSRSRQTFDVALIALVQGIPLPLLVCAALGAALPSALVTLNAALFAIRCAMNAALAGSYAVRGIPYWLSPIADPAAAWRVGLSSLVRARAWRGRRYSRESARDSARESARESAQRTAHSVQGRRGVD